MHAYLTKYLIKYACIFNSKYACIYILTSINTIIKQRKINMHAYLIKYACIFTLTFVNTVIKQKKIKYACIYNKHAQNYTKYAQNGNSTNGTPYV